MSVSRDSSGGSNGPRSEHGLARERASVERVRVFLRGELDGLLAELSDWSRPAPLLYDAFLQALERVYPPDDDPGEGDPPSRSV
jgi:hypothetical protein